MTIDNEDGKNINSTLATVKDEKLKFWVWYKE